MSPERLTRKKSLKGGMSLLELSVVLTAFVVILSVTMIGGAAIKGESGRPDRAPMERKAPKRTSLPAQIALLGAGGWLS